MKKTVFSPFQILCAFMLLPLGASVAVQYNDPDGVVWMVIYGYSIFITLLAIFGVNSPWSIPGALGYLAGFVYLLPSFEAPYLKSELTREGGGMFIAAAWMFCLVLAWYLKERPTEQDIPSVSASGGGCGSGSCGCGKQAG